MNNQGKPMVEKMTALLSRLFAWRVNPNQVPPRLVRTGAAAPIHPELATDPAARFKSHIPRQVISTPLPAPQPQSQPSLQHPASHVYIPPASQPPLATPRSLRLVAARRPFFELAKTLPAFWTVASLISVLVNVLLIVALVVLGREFFALKAIVGDKLLGGLYENFIYMDQAHIQTSINVSDTIPINFTLPISQDTVVVLTQNTPISGANVRINTGGMTIHSPANIILPAGTNLPIHLELSVPVTTSVPINITVPIDIPLQQTELHKPFIGLQQVVAPFYTLMQPQIKTAQDLPLCEPYSAWCASYFK